MLAAVLVQPQNVIGQAKAHPASFSEARTAQALDAASKMGPAALRGFLYEMPKGADLHYHLDGGIYAETFLRDAAHDGLCIDTTALAIVKPMAQTRSIPPQPVCGDGRVRADSVAKDQHLYDQLIDAFSMRSFVPTSGRSGHDQFFDTFDRFIPVEGSHLGEWLDEIAVRAATQNEQYLEIMHTPGQFLQAAAMAEKAGYNPDFAQYRKQLLDAGLRDLVPAIRADLDKADAQRREVEGAAENHPPLPLAKSRFAISTRCFAPRRRIASSPRSCSALSSPRRIRASSALTSSSPKTVTSR